MPRLQPLLAAALAICLLPSPSALGRTALQGARQAFEAEAARQCPTRHLENMTAGDLELIMEGFETRFAPAETRAVQDAIGGRCARIEAGLTCGNNATLEVFRRRRQLKPFVRQACASGWTCKAFADCTHAPQP